LTSNGRNARFSIWIRCRINETFASAIQIEAGRKVPQDRSDLSHVYDYYCSERPTGYKSDSLYKIWERGEAFNDSITPSIFVPEYRSHVVLKALTLTGEASNILSLGCGNGFVEGDLVTHGRNVRAVDCLEEAVELARAKGVDAFAGDFFALEPHHFEDIDMVFGDGILGHLFDREEEMKPALNKLASLGLKPGSWLFFSNDPPRDPEVPFAPHEVVPGFWFLSRNYLHASLASFGFDPVESYYFPYRRPVSGLRNRTICIARVP
jgi:SAM-dependent methyltransferase